MSECHTCHCRHSIFSRRFSREPTGKAGGGRFFQGVLGAMEKNKAGRGRAGEAVISHRGRRKGHSHKDTKEVQKKSVVREWGKELQTQSPARQAQCARGHSAAPCGPRATGEGQGEKMRSEQKCAAKPRGAAEAIVQASNCILSGIKASRRLSSTDRHC